MARIITRYAWLRDLGKQAGQMRLTPRDRCVQKVVVTLS